MHIHIVSTILFFPGPFSTESKSVITMTNLARESRVFLAQLHSAATHDTHIHNTMCHCMTTLAVNNYSFALLVFILEMSFYAAQAVSMCLSIHLYVSMRESLFPLKMGCLLRFPSF